MLGTFYGLIADFDIRVEPMEIFADGGAIGGEPVDDRSEIESGEGVGGGVCVHRGAFNGSGS